MVGPNVFLAYSYYKHHFTSRYVCSFCSGVQTKQVGLCVSPRCSKQKHAVLSEGMTHFVFHYRKWYMLTARLCKVQLEFLSRLVGHVKGAVSLLSCTYLKSSANGRYA